MDYDLRYDDTNCDPDKWVPISDTNVIPAVNLVGYDFPTKFCVALEVRESQEFFLFLVLGLQ